MLDNIASNAAANAAVDMKMYGLREQTAYERYDGCLIGRILSQEKGQYRLICEKGELPAELSGRLRHRTQSAADLPAVGDFVQADCGEGDGLAMIRSVLPRKSVFLRRSAGTAHTSQVVAANVDTVFLCMSLNQDFNLRRLERYLTVAWDSGARPVVVLTKADLCPDVASRLRAAESCAMGVDILMVSALAEDGYDALLPYIRSGETVALIGSSGVGKSTLINRLLSEERLQTGGLRHDGRGRHTTTRRELLLLPQGGLVIDTPGMRELGLWDAGAGLDRSFADIETLAAQCRFADCSHTGEPDCAVRAALSGGTLSRQRWLSYQKLSAENAYAADTEEYLAQKKDKFKNIAKVNKLNRKK